jgi:hypothetical protein
VKVTVLLGAIEDELVVLVAKVDELEVGEASPKVNVSVKVYKMECIIFRLVGLNAELSILDNRASRFTEDLLRDKG